MYYHVLYILNLDHLVLAPLQIQTRLQVFFEFQLCAGLELPVEAHVITVKLHRSRRHKPPWEFHLGLILTTTEHKHIEHCVQLSGVSHQAFEKPAEKSHTVTGHNFWSS